MSDLLIIGSGIAGLSCAIRAKELGIDSVVVSKAYPTKCQSVMAQGGINCGVDEDIEKHIDDTINRSCGLGDEKSIEFMCRQAPKAIEKLESFGVPFSRDREGNIARRKLGGTQGKYACFTQDYTGLKIVHTMFDWCNKQNQKFISDHFLLSTKKLEDGSFATKFLNIALGEIESIRSKAVVFATGGYSKIYGECTTNSHGTTGDGIVVARNAGCKITSMEFVQFHPTSLKEKSVLISESARGEGGYLICDGERFINELLPRDVISRAINQKIKEGKKVYLDIRHLGEEFIKNTIPQEAKLAKFFQNCDVTKEMIEIKPSAHYSIGGIETDSDGKTSVDGIYACGECADSKVHGGNRLGGNSLLEAFVFGEKTAESALEYIRNISLDDSIDKDKEENKFIQKGEDFYPYSHSLSRVLNSFAGLEREEKNLLKAKDEIVKMKEKLQELGVEDNDKIYNTNLIDFLEFKNELEIGEMIVDGALKNETSSGVHYRTDR